MVELGVGTVAGTPLGVWLLATLPASTLVRLIGLMLIAIVLLEWLGLYPERLPGRGDRRYTRAELEQKGKLAGKGAGMLAGAGIAGVLALGALTAGLIAALALAMATWDAALIVMVLWAIVALVLAKAAQKSLQKATPPVPQTVETVKEDIQWAKNPTGSAQR